MIFKGADKDVLISVDPLLDSNNFVPARLPFSHRKKKSCSTVGANCRWGSIVGEVALGYAYSRVLIYCFGSPVDVKGSKLHYKNGCRLSLRRWIHYAGCWETKHEHMDDSDFLTAAFVNLLLGHKADELGGGKGSVHENNYFKHWTCFQMLQITACGMAGQPHS